MKCAPGTYSENGVEPCVPCAKGSYQSGIGALSCVECTGGKSTYGPGADSADMCVGKIYGKRTITCMKTVFELVQVILVQKLSELISTSIAFPFKFITLMYFICCCS